MSIFTLPVIASVLSVFVPKIAKWVNGEKGEQAAQSILTIAQDVTGLKASDAIGMEKLVDKLSLDPNLEIKFIQAIQERDVDFDRMYLDDRQDARRMQIVTVNSGKSTHAREFIYRFAWFVSTFSFVYFLAITFVTIPEGSQRFADTILGFLLGTVMGAIISFFYGSSKPVKDDE